MADSIKVYEQEIIDDTPFTTEGEVDLNVSQKTSNDVYSSQTIKEHEFPVKRTAVELLSTALNTKSKRILKEFEFTPSGAIQIGEYEQGSSGDIRISPDGIVARDESGSTTFALDGATGNAVFAGSIQSGSLITGEVVVGNNSVLIDGTNKRIIVNDGTYDRVLIGFQENGF